MQIGKALFIYSGKYTGPKVFGFVSSVAMKSAENVDVPVPVNLQDLRAVRSPPLQSSADTLRCGVRSAVLRLLAGASVYFENLSSRVLEKCNALPGSSKPKVRKVPCGQH